MKTITFVIAEAKLHEQLSIMSLSASLKKGGHHVSLVHFENSPSHKKKILDAIKRENPDFIAFSFMSGAKSLYTDLAKYIKQEIDCPLVIGGPAATFDEDLKNIDTNPFDAVCIGEGDVAFVGFIDRYIEGKKGNTINNFIMKSQDGRIVTGGLLNLIDPLDQLPFPDRKIIYDKDSFLRNSKIKMFMSGRGCPYKCTYCFNHKYNTLYREKGRIVRHKSVDYFLQEIHQVQRDYPLEGIIFEDDIFILNKAWLEEFALKYPKHINLPYMCYVRPNLVSKEIAKLLRISGCYSVRVAIECGNETLRNQILKRNLRNEQVIKSCKILNDEGLKIGTINILGLPTETIENMKETLIINRACKPAHVSANMFMPLPGVDLTFFAIQKGLLDKNFAASKSTHHISEMKYPDDVKAFLYPFKALFPLIVKYPGIEKIIPLLMKLPHRALSVIDSVYRLYSNAKFYPSVHFSIRDKWRALRRYSAIVSK